MRKICNIDGPASYQHTGLRAFAGSWSRRRHKINLEWFEQHFTEPQKRILCTHGYALRPHPRHNPDIELFIDEQNLTERDWTLIRLLF